MATANTAIRHPLFARFYERLSRFIEAKGGAEHRSELLGGLSGRVLEVGAGNGLNFAHYPPAVTEVVAVEPEPYLRARADEAARSSPVPVRVLDGVATELPVADESFDAGVVSLVLCTVPDPDEALATLARAIRPGGELRFYEHVRASTPGLARVQRATDVVWPHLAGGCHTSRDSVGAIRRAGFVVEACRELRFLGGPTAPHVIGRARRP